MISWESYRHPPYASFPWQRILFLLVPLGLVAAFLAWQGNYLGAGVFGAVGIVGLILMFRPQEIVACSVGEDALVCGKKRYAYPLFYGFARHEYALVFLPKKKHRKPLVIPLPGEGADMVVEAVSHHLPKTEHEESPSDLVKSFFRI